MDTYDRRARLYPLLILLVPLGLGITSWIPVDFDTLKTLAGFAVALGLAAFMGQIARDQGKKKEPMLFGMWGGKPSATFLSYQRKQTNLTTLKRCHARLKELDESLEFPNSEEGENANPDQNRIIYESASDLLVSATRDRAAFPLVFQENINYGFRRNVWGMKPSGVAIACMGIFLCTIKIRATLLKSALLDQTAALGLIISAMLLTFWVIRVTPNWVKLAADAYARQLILSCENI